MSLTRLSRGVIGLGSLLAMLAGSAQAVPPVLDLVPSDAAFVVAVPSAATLEKNIQTVSQWVGFPLPIGIDDLTGMLGLAGGLDKNGSFAVVVLDVPDPDKGMEPPNMYIMIPTSDYGALIKGLGGTVTGGIDSVAMQGEDSFAKSIPGYALIAPRKEILEKIDGKGGNAAKHRAFLGAAGDRLTETSDVCFIINGAKVRPLVERGLKEGMQQLKDRAGMMGGGAVNTAAAEWMVNMVVADTRAVVAGAHVDSLGVSLDTVLAFNEGSKLAKATAAAGGSAALLGKLPNQPYLLAFAGDFSGSGFKDLLAEMPAGAAQPGSMSMKDMMANNKGMATSLGFTPGGLMAGLFSRAVSYTATSDFAASMAQMKKGMDEMKKAGLGEGTFTEDAADVGGTKVAAYDIKMSPDGDNPMAAQVMLIMFGAAGGPNGYIAKVDGGYVQTMSKSSDLMAAALAAAKGENSLATDKLTQQVSDKLPKGRAVEVFIGFKSILDTVLPLVTQFAGMQVKFEAPQTLPPVGMGMAPSEGSMHAAIYVPQPVIKTTADFVRAMQASANGGRGNGGDDAPKKQDSGQPKF